MEPFKPEYNRQEDGRFGPGNNANPKGRPTGQTLKEYIRQRFLAMTDEEKDAFMAKLDPIDIFKMGEGNPHNTSEADLKNNGGSFAGATINIIQPNESGTEAGVNVKFHEPRSDDRLLSNTETV